MKPGQPQIFKNRLFENLSTRVSKSEKYKRFGKSGFGWSYERKYDQDERENTDRKKYNINKK